MAKKRKKSRKSATSFMLGIIFLIVVCAGYYVYNTYFNKDDGEPSGGVQAIGELSFHFMMLGNANAGDCVYVKAGENDVLIDAGSRANSVDDIENYLNKYVTDGTLEYVIVTHADQDHIAGFASSNSIFDLYECENIIDFNKSNKSLTTNNGNPSLYANYLSNRDAEIASGANHYTALECYNDTKGDGGAERVFNLTDDGNIKMEILYNYFYENHSSDENNYSVCVRFYHGSRQFIFTGDLEEEGEEKLAEKYDFSQVELFKAGHHGSPTSSNDCLLREIKPKICVACCCAGSVEYTDNLANTFPSQAVINRIAKYTDKFYVPVTIDIKQNGTLSSGEPNYDNDGSVKILNGDIVVVSEGEKDVYVQCSNNDTLLKDTEWFKQYRTCPDEWN